MQTSERCGHAEWLTAYTSCSASIQRHFHSCLMIIVDPSSLSMCSLWDIVTTGGQFSSMLEEAVTVVRQRRLVHSSTADAAADFEIQVAVTRLANIAMGSQTHRQQNTNRSPGGFHSVGKEQLQYHRYRKMWAVNFDLDGATSGPTNLG